MVFNQARDRRAVGTFPDRETTERALQQLRESGFPMDRVSVIAKDQAGTGEIAGAEVQGARAPGNTEAREGAGVGAVSGTVLGGIGGLLVGLGALAIPGAGPFFAAGTLATTFAGAGIGAAGGGLIGALTGLGIPEEQARSYQQRLERGEYLVVVEGTEAEIQQAAAILSPQGIHEWGTFGGGPISGDRPSEVAPGPTDVERRYVDRDRPSEGVVEVIDRREDTR